MTEVKGIQYLVNFKVYSILSRCFATLLNQWIRML